jgi:hypothetical protein
VPFRGLLLAALLLLAGPGRAAATQIIGPEEVLRSWTVERGGRLYFALDGVEYELVTDPSSPLVSPLGDGQFHPMSSSEVEGALLGLGALTRRLQLRVVILPYPRRHVLKSSCHGQTIVLSPGIREVAREHVWSTVVHEVGHALQHRLVPEGGVRWLEYVRLRGLEDPRYHQAAAHRDHPREIFAEDFRYLFGGHRANYSGSIENSNLPLPDEVAGLQAFFLELVGESAEAPITAGYDIAALPESLPGCAAWVIDAREIATEHALLVVDAAPPARLTALRHAQSSHYPRVESARSSRPPTCRPVLQDR